MSAQILDGNAIAASLRVEIAATVEARIEAGLPRRGTTRRHLPHARARFAEHERSHGDALVAPGDACKLDVHQVAGRKYPR